MQERWQVRLPLGRLQGQRHERRGHRPYATRAASLRAEMGHPVVDADGHWIETAPVMKGFFLDYVKDLGGADLMARFEASGGLDYDDTVLRPWSEMSEEGRRISIQQRSIPK